MHYIYIYIIMHFIEFHVLIFIKRHIDGCFIFIIKEMRKIKLEFLVNAITGIHHLEASKNNLKLRILFISN